AVEVEQQQRDLALLSSQPSYRALDSFGDEEPVGKAGERVTVGQRAQPVLHRLSGRDVGEHAEEAGYLTALPGDDAGGDGDMPAGSVPAGSHLFVIQELLAVAGAREEFEERCATVGRDVRCHPS